MTTPAKPLIGAIEGGGTKFVCALGDATGALLERESMPTRDPVDTLARCAAFFSAVARRHGAIAAIGFGSFGPLQLLPGASDYGCMLATPKLGWSGANLLAPLRELGVPVVIDTDVATAARGELYRGAGRGRGSLAYVTVGTGIGGAVAPSPAGARLMHAEMGHLIVRRDPRDAGFQGICPFHADCLEGLASGPAIQARWGCDLSQLPPGHAGRDVIAGYLSQLAVAIALLHSPAVIVLGGGVMSDESLLPAVRRTAHALLAGYLPPLRDAKAMEDFLQAPALAADSAIVGAMHMALEHLSGMGRPT
jgi:fructokinase